MAEISPTKVNGNHTIKVRVTKTLFTRYLLTEFIFPTFNISNAYANADVYKRQLLNCYYVFVICTAASTIQTAVRAGII